MSATDQGCLYLCNAHRKFGGYHSESAQNTEEADYIAAEDTGIP